MPDAVTLPFWLAAVLVVLAVVAIVDRLLTPSVRWLLRRRVERVLDELEGRNADPVKGKVVRSTHGLR